MNATSTRSTRHGDGRFRHAPRVIELVGLAGVGKSHLKVRLLAWLGERGIDVVAVRTSTRWLPQLAAALLDTAPVVWLLMKSGSAPLKRRMLFAKAITMQAWRERIVARESNCDSVVIVEEGWFHKLRQLRRLTGPGVSFSSLPRTLQRRFASADLILFLTADSTELCARKLRRQGQPVTPETLRQQYLSSEKLGQWSEHLHTQFDLRQAVETHQVRYVTVDYHDGFDLESELVPILERHGVA